MEDTTTQKKLSKSAIVFIAWGSTIVLAFAAILIYVSIASYQSPSLAIIGEPAVTVNSHAMFQVNQSGFRASANEQNPDWHIVGQNTANAVITRAPGRKAAFIATDTGTVQIRARLRQSENGRFVYSRPFTVNVIAA